MKRGWRSKANNYKLAFAVRLARKLTVVTASEPLPSSRSAVEARLADDGHITLSVNGQQVGEGRAAGPLVAQPARGFTVGKDDAPVGDYASPNVWNGKIEDVKLRVL